MAEVTKKILFLSANPRQTNQLRVDEELREIKEGLRRAEQRAQFILESAEAVRYRDLRRAVLDNTPNIVHFSGHGAGEDGLVFEDGSGQVKLIDANAIAGLFKLFADTVECVVLNACYSQIQAEEISQHIPFVVGMGRAIGDRAAIEFAIAFYDAIGSGRDYQFAFDYACNAIDLAGIPESDTPKLLRGKASETLPHEDRPPSKEIKLRVLELIHASKKSYVTNKEIAYDNELDLDEVNCALDNLEAEGLIELISEQSFSMDVEKHAKINSQGKVFLKNKQSGTYQPNLSSPISVDRNQLLNLLKGLIPAQFNQLIFVLNIPDECLPGQNTPQLEKAIALLKWASAPGGIGLDMVRAELDKIINPQ